MVKHAPGATTDYCPHIDQNDSRCGHRFRLGRIEQAFNVCFGAYHGCPMYHRMNREAADVARGGNGEWDGSSVPLVTVSTHGRALPLRPTGT